MKAKMIVAAKLLAPLGALLVSGCTAKYQQRILDLNDRCSQLQSELTRKERVNQELGAQVRRIKAERDQLELRLGKLREKEEEDPFAGMEKGEAFTRDGKLVLPDKVTFRSGSRALTAKGRKILDALAGVLKERHAGRRIYVLGHTDTDPIKKTKDKYRSNRHLSAERADAVAAYLVRRGVPEKAIAIIGYGYTSPAGSNKTAPGRARNRRVEIMIGQPL
jgi:flagellar motor protein MotB